MPGAHSEAAAGKAYPNCDAVPCEFFETAFEVSVAVHFFNFLQSEVQNNICIAIQRVECDVGAIINKLGIPDNKACIYDLYCTQLKSNCTPCDLFHI